ncbi:hypothetical protein NHQ30_006125 [Ciborinia camelliae]|nr:hypothetical protein NHQ30_006125 [Ciborinia camelliae]
MESVLIQDSPRATPNRSRPDTPAPNSQRVQPQRLESPAKNELENSSNATQALPSPLNSTPNEEAPISMPTKESLFIYVDTPKGQLRFKEIECDIIRKVIEENHQNNEFDEDYILQLASEAVINQAGTARLAHECWSYWFYRGKQESRIDWPAKPEDVNETIMISGRNKIAPYAITPDEAALRKAPIASTAPATVPPTLWPKEQKEFLYKTIKNKKEEQYRRSRETFWQEVGEDMTEAGYSERYQVYRDYWVKDGRFEFNYDENPYFDRRPTPPTSRQKNPNNRTRPPESRYNSRGRPLRDEDYTPNRSRERRSSLSDRKFQSIRVSGESMGARRRSLSPDSPPINPTKTRKRTSTGDVDLSLRPKKKRVPSSPRCKSPKAPVPQRTTDVIHNMHSNAHVKDNTPKVASQFSLDLFVPATGQVVRPSDIDKEEKPPDPPHRTTQPVAPSMGHDTPNKTSTNAMATQQPLHSSTNHPQPPARELSSNPSVKDTEPHRPDIQRRVQPSHDDPTKITQPFDLRASPENELFITPEPTPAVSQTAAKKSSTSKNQSKRTTQPTEQTKSGSDSLKVGETAHSTTDAPVKTVAVSESETPQRNIDRQSNPIHKPTGSARDKEKQVEVESLSTVPDSSNDSAAAISRTHTKVEGSIHSVSTYATDKDGHRHHLYQNKNVTQDLDVIDYSDEDTIVVENNTSAKAITRPEEPTLVPMITASTKSRLSATPSLTDDHSMTSDEVMVDAPPLSQGTSMDAEVEPSGLITRELLQENVKYVDSQISNMQKDLLKIKEDKAETEKKLAEVEQEIKGLTIKSETLKRSHDGNMEEIKRLEAKLESRERYKGSLIHCIETNEKIV